KTENLKKQIEEDKITWTMISEELSPKIEGSTLGDYYGVIGIPTIFLVGKDGKIITSELRGAKLYSTVSQLFEEE
ncbi:MAG: hypothetical protein LBT05_01150, partial [Planctomycetaceae bacterium]|nr:hypothetical protein [Planctomycetaceae bacterium]